MILGLTSLLLVPDFAADQAAFRKQTEAELTDPKGWLAVAGLFWLHEGSFQMGSGDGCEIQLPKSAPATVGTVTMKGKTVTFTKSGEQEETLQSNKEFMIGDLTLALIQRGQRTGFRMWDPNSEARKNFKGCQWFAPNPKWVIKAKFIPHKKGTTIPITNVLGDTSPNLNPGAIEFTMNGKKCHLEAVAAGDGLFFDFTDLTTNKTTYSAGRFLDTPGPKDGFVTVDFNHAVNPPCAVTDFATCPLPPKGNHLPIAVTAGEKAPSGHHH